MPEINRLPHLEKGNTKFACSYTCECGRKIIYQDENGKPDRLMVCFDCVGPLCSEFYDVIGENETKTQ